MFILELGSSVKCVIDSPFQAGIGERSTRFTMKIENYMARREATFFEDLEAFFIQFLAGDQQG